jgi:tRNA(fMet)-specific endonuclease VapC
MPVTGRYLLDTNVLVALVRAGPLGRYIEQTYSLSHQAFRPLICVVTVGEIKKLTRKFGWGPQKTKEVETLLSQLIWVDINEPALLEAYAEIAHYSESNGNTKSQNDYWIAAAAKVTDATLLTSDRDFDHLQGRFLDRIWIDERIVKPP